MSDNPSTLQQYINRLRDQAKIEKNDVRHRHYVGYTNEFISHFVNERAYLVGSTGENLRLRWSKDGGDSDFLLCSGAFEIPVENVLFREDTPCFVWIKGDGLESKIKFDLVQGRYIPTSLLRTVSPELFTMLRGIYLIVTSTQDTIPGRKSRVTTTALRSRVGLARTQYRNLRIPDSRISHPRERTNKRIRKRSEPNTNMPEIKAKDKEMIDLIINMIVMARKLESTGEGDGQFGNFAHVMHRVQKRRQLGSYRTVVMEGDSVEGIFTYLNNLDEEPFTGSKVLGVKRPLSSGGVGDDTSSDKALSGIEATYEEISSKDFVPALRIKGMLKLMVAWGERGGFWPRTEDRDRISRCEVFVVSRYAPITPDEEKDFCLSFNQSEMELAECFSESQRDVFLIIKSFLKGGFQNKHSRRNVGTEMKLKTFHLKTALYWVSEKEDPSLWLEGNTSHAVRKILMFLQEAARTCRLEHYFIPKNNLFAGFEKEERDFIIDCINDALSDPVAYIQHFFNLDDGKPVPITLTNEEVDTLLEMNEDGGLDKQADVIEEALFDFHRAMNEGPRDDRGNSPMLDAIQDTFNKFLQDVEKGELADLQNKRDLEKLKSTVETGVRTMRLTQETGATEVVNTFIGSLGGSGDTASTSQNNQGQQLLANAISLFANSQNMDRENRRNAENELKKKAFSFFLGKPF